MHSAEQQFLIDDRVQLFLVAPIWLSTATIGMSPKDRKSLLQQLWREFNFEKAFVNELAKICGEDIKVEIFCRITLFDYGLGNIEVSLNLPVASINALEELGKKAESLKLMFVDEFKNGLANAKLDLSPIDQVYKSFSRRNLVSEVNQLRPDYDESIVSKRSHFMCGPVSRNLLFVNSCGVCPQIGVTS